MDNTFVVYQMRMQLNDFLHATWKSEIMTFKYWGAIAFILIYYAIWWKLTDKRRISDLLLFGAFETVITTFIELICLNNGLWFYKVRLLPVSSNLFLHAFTIAPLTYMVAQQYSPNWKQFFIRGALSSVWINFVLLPVLSLLGVFQLMKWNYIYGFFLSYVTAIFIRGAFHLVKQVQQKALEEYDNPLQSTLMQPAFKRMDEDSKDKQKQR